MSRKIIISLYRFTMLIFVLTLPKVFIASIQHSEHVFTYEKASPQDLPKIRKLLEKTLPATFQSYIPDTAIQFIIDYKYQAISANLYNPNDYIVITKNQHQKVVGIIRFTQLNEHTLYLSSMYVMPDYQHKGIGKQLLQQWHTFMPLATTIEADVALENVQAQKFYTKQGFQIIHEKTYTIEKHHGILLVIRKIVP